MGWHPAEDGQGFGSTQRLPTTAAQAGERGAGGGPSPDPGKEISVAYKELLHVRQPSEGLAKKVWDIPCISGKEWESASS